MKFSTKDDDNDLDKNANCIIAFTGGWWYNNCYQSSLNGKYGVPTFQNGAAWN